MKFTLILIPLLTACSPSVEANERYEVEVAYGYPPPGSPPDGLEIVSDPKTIYPKIINNCGGLEVEEIEMTDGMTKFQFAIPISKTDAASSCMRSKLPGLAEFKRSF